MSNIGKAITVSSKEEYYSKHFNIINPFLPQHLTDTEIEILTSFMALEAILIEEDMFNTEARKRVRGKLNLSTSSLSNHLRSLVKKGFLRKHDITKRITINQILIPAEVEQNYMFRLKYEG